LEVETVALSVLNDVGVVERLRGCFERVAPDLRRHEAYRTMVSEDVSYLMEGRAGAYFFVGSANAARGLNYTHHHPRFDIDEDALVIGAGLLASAAAEWVMG
jgi:amidohydrolase